MRTKVYVVTMYRWRDRENHSYVLGVYTTREKAVKAGEREREYRGGNKYYPECLEVFLDTGKSDKNRVVVALEQNTDFKINTPFLLDK